MRQGADHLISPLLFCGGRPGSSATPRRDLLPHMFRLASFVVVGWWQVWLFRFSSKGLTTSYVPLSKFCGGKSQAFEDSCMQPLPPHFSLSSQYEVYFKFLRLIQTTITSLFSHDKFKCGISPPSTLKYTHQSKKSKTGRPSGLPAS